jgi:hypothetical protein
MTKRTQKEILAAERLLCDKVWYGRKDFNRLEQECREGKIRRDILEGAKASARKMEEKYGLAELLDWVEEDDNNNFGWGFLSGNLSALRWVLGDEWDNLDT